MKTLHGMLLKSFLPAFFIIMLFFVLLFELVDASTNLWRFLSHETSLLAIATIAFYYLPKCIAYSLPLSLLFSVAFTLGNFYRNNEVISVFGSGINLTRFVLPLILLGVSLSVGNFYFEEKVVISTIKTKNQLVQTALKQTVTYSNSNVTVKSSDNRFVYNVNYYNDKNQTLSGLLLLEKSDTNEIVRRVDADYADWNGSNWVLHNCQIYEKQGDLMSKQVRSTYSMEELTEAPAIFRRVSFKIDEMEAEAAASYIESLKKAGLSYQEPLTEYYRKFSFALTPLIAVLIASAVGGLFKKNVLLMSLLFSLAIFIVYYVVQMVTLTLARNGVIAPAYGAWTSFVIFLIVGIGLFRVARS